MSRISRIDKLRLLILLLLWFGTGAAVELMDCAAQPVAQPEDKPPVTLTWEAPIDQPRLLEAMALQLEPDLYREDVPLERELQETLHEACEASGVPVPLALGLIETESGFQTDAVSREGAYGLCQLNPKYFPADLTPAGNIRAGVAYLGELLERHGDPAAALTAYNAGHDTGSRTYANAVLAAAERWKC